MGNLGFSVSKPLNNANQHPQKTIQKKHNTHTPHAVRV